MSDSGVGKTNNESVDGPLGQSMWARADKVIPQGGIFFTRSARFAGRNTLPGFIVKAEGCTVTDIDGRDYIDFNCGNGPNLLGYQHPEIESIARAQAQQSDLAPFFNPAMVEYAEKLVALSDSLDWAVTVKNGSDATNLALRTMRAVRQRPFVIMKDHAYVPLGTLEAPLSVTEE